MTERKVPTIKELRAEAYARRRQGGSSTTFLQYTNIVHRPLSIYLTRLLLMTGISPDAVTLISYAFAIAAGVLFIFGNYWYNSIGIAVYQLFTILDECDGDMSRYLYGVNKNPRGGFLEDMGHSVIQPFIIICIAFGIYNNPQSLLVGSLFYKNIIVLILGFVGSNLYLALHVFDYYSRARGKAPKLTERTTPSAAEKVSLLSRFRGVVNEYSLGDLLLLLTAVSNTFWLYLILWAAIHIPLVTINSISSYKRLPKPKLYSGSNE